MEEWGFSAGDEVLLRGLSKLELNGQRGTVLPLESPEQARQLGRLPVMMHSGKQLSLKVVNLVKIQERPRSSASCGAFSRSARRKLIPSSMRAGGRELVVMIFNLQYLASFPQDPNVARRRLLEITGGKRPDVIAVQEALEGIDLLAEVGYTKLISSAVKAVALREALYGDENALEAVPSVAHDSLMVNELYLNADCHWEVLATGVEQISSSRMVSIGGNTEVPLAPRSVVWVKLGLGSEGPAVFVMNTQLSGSRIEDELLLPHLADERMGRAIDRCGNQDCVHLLPVGAGPWRATSEFVHSFHCRMIAGGVSPHLLFVFELDVPLRYPFFPERPIVVSQRFIQFCLLRL